MKKNSEDLVSLLVGMLAYKMKRQKAYDMAGIVVLVVLISLIVVAGVQMYEFLHTWGGM